MKSKMMNCKVCGAEIAKNAKACPHCGAKNKKPFYKKWWVWVIAVLFIAALGADDTETTSTETTEAQNTVVEAVESVDVDDNKALIKELDFEETQENEMDTTDESDLNVSIETIIELIESTVAQNFEYYNVEGDETGITITVAADGVATEVVLAKSQGYDETYEPWMEVKENLLYMYDSTYELMETLGMDNPVLTMIVANDLNTDNILLMIMFDTVVYDVMAEQ